jgi:DNA-directed RNA polymerase sigma subunit (sigma70/sigma32)
MSPEPNSEGPGVPRQATTPGQETSASELEALAAQVRRVRPLRPGEQKGLLEQVESGFKAGASERLLETHLGMVLDLARSKAGRGLPIGDLFQEGSVGLLAAIRAFPSAEDRDFDHFAAGQVALSMEDALSAEEEAVRQEQLLIQAAADYDRVELQLARELRRAPTPAEIGLKLEWSVERTETVRQIVDEARRRHDEELLLYVEPDEVIDILDEDELGDR